MADNQASPWDGLLYGLGVVAVLWLTGADAVGKSTVAWEVYDSLTTRGVAAAYVDTDYLGFCSPSPYDDPSPLVAANLTAMWPNFRAAGATCLVVSGVMVTREQRRLFDAAIPGTALTVCLLRASADSLAERILRRGRAEGAGTDGAASGLTLDGLAEYGRRAAEFAALLDTQGVEDFRVDTDNTPVPDVAEAVLRQLPEWPATPRPSSDRANLRS